MEETRGEEVCEEPEISPYLDHTVENEYRSSDKAYSPVLYKNQNGGYAYPGEVPSEASEIHAYQTEKHKGDVQNIN